AAGVADDAELPDVEGVGERTQDRRIHVDGRAASAIPRVGVADAGSVGGEQADPACAGARVRPRETFATRVRSVQYDHWCAARVAVFVIARDPTVRGADRARYRLGDLQHPLVNGARR